MPCFREKFTQLAKILRHHWSWQSRQISTLDWPLCLNCKMGEWWNNKEWIGIHNGGTIGNGRDFIVLKMADCQNWRSEIFSLIPKNYIRHCNWTEIWKKRTSVNVGWVGFSAGGLTSLEASLVRCFTFSETSPKTSRGDVFFKTSLEHRTVKQKVRCFYTMF